MISSSETVFPVVGEVDVVAAPEVVEASVELLVVVVVLVLLAPEVVAVEELPSRRLLPVVDR